MCISDSLARERGEDNDMQHLRRRYHQLDNKPADLLTKEEKQEKADIRGSFFKRFGSPLEPGLNSELRRDMHDETEDVFSYVVHEDRSLLELIDSDYTFLNERLAHQ